TADGVGGPAASAHPHMAARRELADAAARLRLRLPEWPGAKLEAKPFSLALHFRQAPQAAASIRQAFSELAAGADFRVLLGRQVVELLPAAALTKGQAVRRLRARLGCELAFYFGDDTTDEDVFRLADPHIVGVKVEHAEAAPGSIATAAQYRLDSPQAVAQGLQAILQVRAEMLGVAQKKMLLVAAIPP
ncbi:MAG: trehalose-phosphatase, partial [Terriglobales bacterium]